MLQERGLDFNDAAEVFKGITATAADERHEYGEPRFITAGYLHGRFVVLVWTPRGTARRIISMRYGHAEEERNWLG
ncbi:BrnT family toxin [Roseomonas chloroacetimidivorans]|uniref:BrnT family toxin n=1 Tax=Roseomonas chloroacetimidivorans TaxID=1766656 RepID=UPI003C73D0F3